MLGDRGPALVGHAGQHDPAVLGVADALDEAPLLHPVEEPGGVRGADAEPVGKAAHRQGAVFLQNPEDLEVAQADAAVVNTAGDGAPPPARQGGDAFRDLAEGSLAGERRVGVDQLTVT